MKKINSKIFAVLTLLLISVPVFCETAVVTFVKGKVEVSRNDKWVAVAVGDSINVSETLSTGFQSEAKIKYKGSIMAMGSLTRITLDELSSQPGKDTVNVYLNTGAVRSKVTHSENRVSHTVRSPVAVASVRGTDFLMSANGAVRCYEGAVVVYPNTEGRYSKKVQVAKPAAEEENESEGDKEADAVVNTGDYGPADSTTMASEIAEDAPAGSIVVGAYQRTEFDVDGFATKPFEKAKENVNKVKNATATVASSTKTNTSTAAADSQNNSSETGTLTVTIEFNE